MPTTDKPAVMSSNFLVNQVRATLCALAVLALFILTARSACDAELMKTLWIIVIMLATAALAGFLANLTAFVILVDEGDVRKKTQRVLATILTIGAAFLASALAATLVGKPILPSVTFWSIAFGQIAAHVSIQLD